MSNIRLKEIAGRELRRICQNRVKGVFFRMVFFACKCGMDKSKLGIFDYSLEAMRNIRPTLENYYDRKRQY